MSQTTEEILRDMRASCGIRDPKPAQEPERTPQVTDLLTQMTVASGAQVKGINK